ncbi:MAG: hypothetical protein JW807_00550 [Spirochaetes bacterium]|nr:hypothetical protein [Spirochaetota bacterium]
MNIILIIILLSIILILAWALLGGKNDTADRRGDASKDQDKTFRRRATDKEIEKQFPDEQGAHLRRRKTDTPEEAAPDTDKPFELPYLADEIIPETSRYRIYRRTLLNSEVYASKGDYSTAISLFEGVRSRIQDIDTRFKIDADIEYLKHYKKKKEEQAKKKEEQARRGETGAAGAGSEIKITLGGSLPDGIKIGSIPDSINIGVIDPSKNLNMEQVVESVTQRIKGELSDVRDEINSLKGTPAAASPQVQSQLAQTLSGLKNRMDRLDDANELRGGVAAGMAGVAGGSVGQTLQQQGDELSDLKREFQTLSRSVKEMASALATESEREPSIAAAKFDSQKPLIDSRSLKELMASIPQKGAPAPSSIREPGGYSPGMAGEAEEKDDFELMSEYGKDRAADELSDDEIFEKILREDGKSKGKQDFEIIGEKKDRREEVTTTDEIDMKQREDESFYRRLLSTTKRKKKELPILKVSYDFTKLPDEIGLSREKNIIEYAFYKYKPMLEKANEYIKKRKVRDAINYYKVVMSQNIPPEFKSMIRKNLDDLTEYLGKYLTGD